MAVELREAREDELEEAAALMVAAYLEYSSALQPRAWEAYARDIADVRSRLPDSRLIVAVEDGHSPLPPSEEESKATHHPLPPCRGESERGVSKLVAAVTYYPPRPEGTGEGWPAGWAGVRLLAVGPEARARGLGRLLMQDCIARARADGAHTMGLHTTELMAVARAMYERMGFERAREFDFHPTPTFTVMAYRLPLGV